MKGFFRFGSPFVELHVEGRKIEFLLDTGFNGHLLLPQHIIEELSLDLIGLSDYLTASGDKKVTKVYKAKVKISKHDTEVPILSTIANIYLAGMELFHEFRIIIERKKDYVEVIESGK